MTTGATRPSCCSSTSVGSRIKTSPLRADIAARKAAEEKLAHQAALTRVGQMAAIVAREPRNPLVGVKVPSRL